MKTGFIRRLLLLSLVGCMTFPTNVMAFNDIRSNDEDIQAIRFIEDLNVFSGTNFEPSKEITKAELFEALLATDEFNVKTEANIEVSFSDVSPELLPYFSRMYKLGVETKKDGLGMPNETLSTWRVLEYIFKFEGIPVQRRLVDTTFLQKNVDNIYPGSWYAPLIERAIRTDLIEPVDRKVDAFGKVTRRDLANLLYNYESFESGLSGGQPVIRVEAVSSKSGIEAEDKFKILEDVWSRVNNDYIEAEGLEKDDLVYGAIEGLVESLDDPYSTFQLPTERTVADDLANEFEGIGASLSVLENGDIVIISPLKDSPAEKSGLLPGDIIIGVNDNLIGGLSLTEVVGLIKGPAGTDVIINVKRDGENKDFTVTRGKIVVEFVTGEMTFDNILILDVRSFGAGTAQEIRKVVDSIGKVTIRGVVLDVRNNPGGFLEQAVEVADVFLKEGTPVVNVDYKTLPDEEMLTSEDTPLEGIPLAVLVNKGSASASEIVAGALQFRANAKIVGETTFGKGTVQQLINYIDSSSLKLTTGEWFIPTDLGERSIHKVGIEPDVKVSITDADREAGIDPQLNKAIQELR